MSLSRLARTQTIDGKTSASSTRACVLLGECVNSSLALQLYALRTFAAGARATTAVRPHRVPVPRLHCRRVDLSRRHPRAAVCRMRLRKVSDFALDLSLC